MMRLHRRRPCSAPPVLAVGVPAQAALSGTSIAYVERTDDGLQILVSVPADATVDTDSVAVTIDGTTAPAYGGSRRRHHVGASHRGARHRHQQLDARAPHRRRPECGRDLPRHRPGRRLRRRGHLRQRRHSRPGCRPWIATRPAREVTDLDLQPADPALRRRAGRHRPWPVLEGQRQLLVLSDGADTSDTALGVVDGGHLGRRSAGQRGRARAGPDRAPSRRLRAWPRPARGG